MLAGPYWIMHRVGLTFDSNIAWATYILTVLGVTLPVALAGGVVYRMGRLLELRRNWRTLLALTCIFGTGLIAYCTMLNPHAPAEALVLAAAGSLFHGAITRHQGRAAGWLALAGLSASFAAVIDPGAIVFLVLLVGVIFALRRPMASRSAASGGICSAQCRRSCCTCC